MAVTDGRVPPGPCGSLEAFLGPRAMIGQGFSQQRQLPGTEAHLWQGQRAPASLAISSNSRVWDSQLRDGGSKSEKLPSRSTN